MPQQRKKVLYILTKDDVGGAQKYVADLASHLDSKLFEAKILRGGVDIPSLSNIISWQTLFSNDIRALIELVRIYTKEAPDVIHLNSSKAGVVGSFAAGIYNLLSRIKGRPQSRVIFTAHGWVFNPTNATSPLVRRIYILLHYMAALFQDYIICVSAFDAALARTHRLAPERKIIMIHNGIDTENLAFLGKVSSRREITTKLGTATTLTDKPWIGSIGRLTKEKDYETFIEAVAKVPESYGFIIGEGSEQHILDACITRLELQDRFFIIPPTHEDAIYLKAFDIFTLTSIKEGLPYVLLEAGAAGIPVVVTNAGGMSEVILDRKTGMVAEQKNDSQLAASYEALLKDQEYATKLVRALGAHIKSDFSLQAMVQKTQSVY